MIDNAHDGRGLKRTMADHRCAEIVAAQPNKSAALKPTCMAGTTSTRMDVACASPVSWKSCVVTMMVANEPGQLLSATHCAQMIDVQPKRSMPATTSTQWMGPNLDTPMAMRADADEQRQICLSALSAGPLAEAI